MTAHTLPGQTFEPLRCEGDVRPAAEGGRGAACAALGDAGVAPAVHWTSSLPFVLFLLATAVLLVRPADLLPGLGGRSLYEPLMIACLLLSARPLLGELSLRKLESTPVAALVVLMLAAIVLSHLSALSFWHARVEGVAFAKVCIYFFLMLALIDSPQRLRLFLHWLVLCALLLSGVAVLHYHGLIELATLSPVAQRLAASGEEPAVLMRLQAVGIFGDPNDLCLLLVVVMGICLWLMNGGVVSGESVSGTSWHPDSPTHQLTNSRARWFWMGPLTLFGYALMLTHSRGGLLALLGGVMAFAIARWGWQRAVLVMVLGLPLTLVLFAGRQTDVNLTAGDDTAQARIQLWSQGMALFRTAPVLGIGQNQYVKETGQVAHNSFVQSYTELGLLGGTVFLGAFAVALWSLWRVCRGGVSGSQLSICDLRFSTGTSRARQQADCPGLLTRAARAQIEMPTRHSPISTLAPYMFAIVCAYAVGLLSLSRAYVVPSYLVLGLAAVYVRLAVDAGAVPALRVDSRLVGRVALAGVVFLIFSYLFIRVFVRW